MLCWICQKNEATSGEHRTKSLDIRAVMGSPNQRLPFWLQTRDRRNIPIGSLKADRLKFPKVICHHCNTALSQPYDLAWEAMSEALRALSPSMREGSLVSISSLFDGEHADHMLKVHLFFVKLLGCNIADPKTDIPIPLEPFSVALQQGAPHPYVFLRFGFRRVTGQIAQSDLQVATFLDGSAAFSTWIYGVGPIAVNVMYSVPGERRAGLKNAWHPSDRITKLIMTDYSGEGKP